MSATSSILLKKDYIVNSTICKYSGGRTSTTPPTSPEITWSPRLAASTKAIPKDSVRAVLRNICDFFTI
jgi:hypothetical protein